MDIELLKNDRIGLTFEYDAIRVEAVRAMDGRRWNPGKKRWEVHLAHLEEVMRIFGLEPADVAPEVFDLFQRKWANRRLRIELGVLKGRIEGAGAPIEEIDAVTSFLVPGHQFSPKFKAGHWDGRRHLFNRSSMRFPTGLWPRIKDVLKRNKIEYELDQPDIIGSGEIQFGPPQTELRDYQQKILLAAFGRRRGIIQLATGGGKTLLAAHLIRRLARPTFFFVHTRDLLHQTHRVLERELGVEIGILGDGHIELADVTVATLQTASRAFGSRPRRVASSAGEDESTARENPTRLGRRKDEIAGAIEAAQVVIFDECHHVPADTAYKIAFNTPNAGHRYGLSATPWRDDHHDLMLEAALGPKISAVTCSDLIERNYLVRPRITMQSASKHAQFYRRQPYPDVYRQGIVENQPRNRAIAAQARDWMAQGLSVLILVNRIEHGKQLLSLLPEARFVHGSLDMVQRRQLIEDLEQKLQPCLIATSLADEGLDIPSLDAIVLAGGGKSATKAYQRIGRALRPAPGKSEAYVLDFFDHAPYLEEHSMSRLKLYQSEPAFDVNMREVGA